MNEKTCSKCGQRYPDFFTACPYCGHQEKVKKGSPVKTVAIVLAVVLVLAAAGFGVWKLVDYTTRKGHYDQGVALMAEGRFVEAIGEFDAAGDFEDSAERTQTAMLAEQHRLGNEAFDSGDYEAAIAFFEAAAGYSDSAARKAEAEKGLHFVTGKAAYEKQDADTAIRELELAGDFPGASALLKNARDMKTYQTAQSQMGRGEYDKALKTLEQIPNWTGAKEDMQECSYHLAVEQLEAGNYSAAIDRFADAGSYADTARLLAQARLYRGKELLSEGKTSDALTMFTEARGRVEDIEPQLENYILLCQAEVAFTTGRLTEGLEHFDKIPTSFRPAEFDINARRNMRSRIQGFARMEGTWTSTKYDVKITSYSSGWIYTKYYPEGALKDQTMTIKCVMDPNGTFDVTVKAKFYYFSYFPWSTYNYTDKSKTISFTLEDLSWAPSSHRYDAQTNVTLSGTPRLVYQANVSGDTASSTVTYDKHSPN